MSGEVQTVGAGNSWVEYGVKNLKQEKGFITMKEMKITYKLDWIAQITITQNKYSRDHWQD